MTMSCEELETQVMISILSGENIVLGTGSLDSKIFPKKIRITNDFQYSAAGGDKAKFKARKFYVDQFDKMNSVAKSLTGYELNHCFVSKDGSNFVLIAGEWNDPKLIWRRQGSGMGANNAVFFNQEKHSIDSFVGEFDQSGPVKPGDQLELTENKRHQLIGRYEEFIASNHAYLVPSPNDRGPLDEGFVESVKRQIENYTSALNVLKARTPLRVTRLLTSAKGNRTVTFIVAVGLDSYCEIYSADIANIISK